MDKIIIEIRSGVVEVSNPTQTEVEIRDYDVQGVDTGKLLYDSAGEPYVLD